MLIPEILEQIGGTLIAALEFKRYPLEEIQKSINYIENILKNGENIAELEKYIRSEDSNFVLFYISNTIYNLKTKSSIQITPETMKWLSSVWKNFLNRNKLYQEAFPLLDEYRRNFESYFPAGSTIVTQIENIQVVKDNYIERDNSAELIKNLESFYHRANEIRGWMKPTYFFMLDYYFERKSQSGGANINAVLLERDGLWGFGEVGYSYGDLSLLSAQALAFLEGIYLILKKKETGKRIIVVDGRQKFMSIHEIYNFYLERLNSAKKELVGIKPS